MPSMAELIKMNNGGVLGNMLAEKFGGEKGRVYPREDSEFIIGFPSEEKTPSVDDLVSAVEEYFTSRGYEVKLKEKPTRDQVELFLMLPKGEESEHSIYVVMNTKYPSSVGGEKNWLRVNTEVFV